MIRSNKRTPVPKSQALRVLASALCCLFSVSFAALSIQHYRVSNPSPPADGVPGISTVAIKPYRDINESRFAKKAEETSLDYLQRVTQMVHLSTYHCETSDFRTSYLDDLAFWLIFQPGEDLFSQGLLYGPRFTCGFCHQRAFIVHSLLTDNAISSEVFTLDGHVVVRAIVEGAAYFLDPDFGVGPFQDTGDAADIRRSAEAIYVGRAGHVDTSKLAEMYGSLDNNAPYAEALTAEGVSYLEMLRAKQERLFRFSAASAAMSAVVAILLAICCLFCATGRSAVPRPAKRFDYSPPRCS
jgi:hypothetical protein